MVKNILVPIDFRVASLNTLKLAMDYCKDQKVNAVLIYAQHLDDSITELMFYSPRKIIRSLQSAEFNHALEIIKNRFEGILGDIKIELFHGNNKNFLNNFLSAQKIEEIFIPKTYELKITKRAFDPIPVIKTANIRVVELEWNVTYNKTEQEQLIALFN
jgi:hypothetical protein